MQLDRLERAYETMLPIVAKNPDGKRLVPVVLRLEDEIRKRKGLDAEYDRILRLAQES